MFRRMEVLFKVKKIRYNTFLFFLKYTRFPCFEEGVCLHSKNFRPRSISFLCR